MATKVPSSVLDRESPAKGFATKPRRFSTLYGICKRGIIYFYSTVKIGYFSSSFCLMEFAMRELSHELSRHNLYSLVHDREQTFGLCEKINNTY